MVSALFTLGSTAMASKSSYQLRKRLKLFQYKLVEHTKNPRVNQFETLIETGAITLDYPIKRQNGKVEDKGCNFKLKASCMELMFPPSERYDLLA